MRCKARCRRSFNGAAAAKPRKLVYSPLVRHFPAPSMEPRLRSRGSRSPGRNVSLYAHLQWSRGCEAAEAPAASCSAGSDSSFNGAAEAEKLGVDPCQVVDLQWSRGCEAAEAGAMARPTSASTPFNGAAAAKPRKPMGRAAGCCRTRSFNGAAAAKPRKLSHRHVSEHPHVPSMEPRLRSRGSCEPDPYRGGRLVLQWSRGCEAAEARGFGRGMNAPAFLQWSRGCEAAEATRTPPTLRWHPPFNGAAAAKPRKPQPRS